MNGLALEMLGKTITVRSSPQAISGNAIGEIYPHSEFEFESYVDDLQYPGDPLYKWVYLGDGKFANYIYPPAGLRLTILREPDDTVPPPPTNPVRVVSLFVEYDDGMIVEFVPVTIL